MIYSVKSKGILWASKLPLNSDKGNTFSIQLSVVKDEKCKKKNTENQCRFHARSEGGILKKVVLLVIVITRVGKSTIGTLPGQMKSVIY